MTTATEYLWFETHRKRELVRLTDDVAKLVSQSRIQEGMVLVSAMHITAGVFVNDPWQQIFYAEFDGQRRKRLIIKAMGV